MTLQTTWRGDNHVCSHLHSFLFLVVTVAVVAAIYRYAAHVRHIVGESLHRLVYLLGKFSRRAHHHTVDGIVWKSAVIEHAQDRQKIGCGLACARLCHSKDIMPVENLGYALLLNGCAGVEMHVVERVKCIVVEF